ncbi:hypothetical protein ACFQMF_01675 [Halorubrum rutilum]|uniref:Uncharacterized protein n=1 Tax=Halorubrum rutilum TaxID=1364933 RepID=A0ABD6AHE6_9EURY|nr:hypothetical protein [Halorubrum rutilum]
MPEPIVIDERELQELYSDLADATTAAATGNPNECASKAADAKERVLELHENAPTLEEIDAVND